MDLEHDDVASARHPGQQDAEASDGEPAHVQAARCRVQLVDLGAPHPEGHEPAARTHWRDEGEGEGAGEVKELRQVDL